MRALWSTPHGTAMAVAALALTGGGGAWLAGWAEFATLIWAAGVVPALTLLAVEIGRQLLQARARRRHHRRYGDGGSPRAGRDLRRCVIALMFTGGNVLEEFAQRRANASSPHFWPTPRIAHREGGAELEDVPVDAVRPGDRLVVKSGEVVPVDGTLLDAAACWTNWR